MEAKSWAILHGVRPANRGCCASYRSFAAAMRFLEGRHPRLTHVPPTGRSSVISAVFFSSCAVNAAANAVEPEPRINRSTASSIPNLRHGPIRLLFHYFGLVASLLRDRLGDRVGDRFRGRVGDH